MPHCFASLQAVAAYLKAHPTVAAQAVSNTTFEDRPQVEWFASTLLRTCKHARARPQLTRLAVPCSPMRRQRHHAAATAAQPRRHLCPASPLVPAPRLHQHQRAATTLSRRRRMYHSVFLTVHVLCVIVAAYNSFLLNWTIHLATHAHARYYHTNDHTTLVPLSLVNGLHDLLVHGKLDGSQCCKRQHAWHRASPQPQPRFLKARNSISSSRTTCHSPHKVASCSSCNSNAHNPPA